MTIDDLGELMIKEFARINEHFIRLREYVDEWFDRLEKRVMKLEALGEDHSGRFISLEDHVSKIHYILEEADPLDTKKRVEKLELRMA